MEPGGYELNDSRYLRDEPPKEIFRQMVLKAREVGFREGSWCDVGCSSGALLRYLDSQFFLHECVGVDPSGELLTFAETLGPSDAVWVQDALPRLELVAGRTFDAVSCIGVLCLMDDITENMRALSGLVGPGGHLFVIDLINPKPIDMIMRFRRLGSQAWEVAYNTFSEATYRSVARDLGMDVNFTPANMPFAIVEGDDPMHAWTTRVGDNPHQVVSGTGQILLFSLATFSWA
jgi:SAM-dependent methyltransferase